MKRGAITASDFLPERVLNFAAEKSGLIRNITVAGADPPIGAQATVPCRVRVRLTTGELIERVTRTIKGSTGRPMTPGEAQAKLRAAAQGVLENAAVERLRQAGADPTGAWPMPALAILRNATASRAPSG